MIKEIYAKTLLNHVKQPDTGFGLKYNMNLYRGCQHQCIYCDSRSDCYRIENFKDVLVKVNAVELLEDALPRKRIRGTIGTGSMNDPYQPLEKKRNLTGRALEVIAKHQFPVHIITKSDLVVRDLDALKEINREYAAVSFTITTADDALGKKVEPGAPPVSDRFKAMRTLADNGILTGVTMTPVLPFLEDNVENVARIVELAHESGASYILGWFGMTLRAGSREYYYDKLEQLFPGVKQKYIQKFGGQYSCNANNWRKLDQVFQERCYKYGIATTMPHYEPRSAKQLKLL